MDASSTSYRTLHPAQVSVNQKGTNIPKGMGFEEKILDLFVLPPTPAPTHASSVDAIDKKRKGPKEAKALKVTRKEKSFNPPTSPIAKEAQTTKGQQKKNTSSRTLKELGGRLATQAFCLETPVHTKL